MLSEIFKKIMEKFSIVTMLLAFLFSLSTTVVAYQYLEVADDKVVLTLFVIFFIFWLLVFYFFSKLIDKVFKPGDKNG